MTTHVIVRNCDANGCIDYDAILYTDGVQVLPFVPGLDTVPTGWYEYDPPAEEPTEE